MSDQNLREKFERAALEQPSNIAIRYRKGDGWGGISYEEFRNSARSLSVFLRKEGVGRGDRIAILLENRPEWPLVFFSAVFTGAVPVPVNPESGSEEIFNILNDSGCSLVFVSELSRGIKTDLRARCPSVVKAISVDSNEFQKELHNAPERFTPAEVGCEDQACILYTSGTTDEPKGVMLTHKNLLSNCYSLFDLELVTRNDSVVSVLPLHHAYPLTVTMLLPLLCGGSIVYPVSMRGEAILEAVRECKATVFVAVPRIFSLFHQEITGSISRIPFPLNLLFRGIVAFLFKIREKTGINLSRYLFRAIHGKFGRSMRFFASGGAKLDENVQRTFLELGFTILEGYGLTETSPVLTMNSLKKQKTGSVGRPAKNVELKIVGPDAQGVGEVIARGPNIMKGYYKRPDMTSEVIKDGWFHTGDLGYLDEEGYLFLTGRLKETIVLSSGKNVYPGELEEAYSRHEVIKEMCVFDVPYEKDGTTKSVLWALVVPNVEFFKKYGVANMREAVKERIANVSKHMPAYQRLMGFTLTFEALPRTLLGKIKRFEVRNVYSAGITDKEYAVEKKEPSEEDIELMESPVGRKVIDLLGKQPGIKKKVFPSDLLELDLGIDSLGRIELASGLEKVFKTGIKEEVVGEAVTVRDLIVGAGPVLPGERKKEGLVEKELSPGSGYWNKTLQVLPKKENLARIDLAPGIMAWLGNFFVLGLIRTYFKTFNSFKAEGEENIPSGGPYILYANHTSYFDAFLVAGALPGLTRLDLFFVGFRIFFEAPVIRGLVKIGRIIPLDFSSHFLEALRSCYYVLENGKCLCFFPEGLRSIDGEVKDFKKGFGILAGETKAKLVPVLIEGSFRAWPRTGAFPNRYPIKVKFGKALDPDEAEKKGYELGAEDRYGAICLSARKAMLDLQNKD
ncbi:MAG: AMP-binding protein [Candidatus Omnitrophota bacterium]|nr:AMP-binding protein [Candidatus Omnitrophota bacterium]